MTLPTHLLWLDLETTGLDPQKDNILEVAATLAKFADPFDVTGVDFHEVIDFKNWSGIDPHVISMHTGNGLVPACLLSMMSLGTVRQKLLKYLPNVEKGSIVIAGNTVHFDKAFVSRNFPEVASFLHYRTYDVSAVRNFAYSLGMPEMEKREQPHRAREDVMASVDLGRTLAKWFRDCATENFNRVIGPERKS